MLASRSVIKPDDLLDIPLIVGRNVGVSRAMSSWLGRDYGSLNIVATFNLIFNAALLVEEKVGYAFCLDKLVKTSEDGILCFKPFEPAFKAEIMLVWKKNQVFSKAAKIFLEKMMLI